MRRFRASRILRPRRARWFAPPPSATAVIFPTGIASGESIGTAFVNDGSLRPAGIPSSEAFGVPSVTVGPVTLSPVGIGTAEAFGTASVTITIDLRSVARNLKKLVGYELLCMARIPQASGPPTFVEVDPIQWQGLSWTDELSKPQLLSASAAIESLPDSVVSRLRDLDSQATEFWLYRNGQLVYAGAVEGWLAQGPTITFTSTGLLGYLRYWTVTSDLVFSQTDQATIVKALVDHWQALDYGNFGIDTSAVTPTGVLRDATYKKVELHNIWQRVSELGKRQNGFDVSVEPASRRLTISYPQQGADRSSGDEAIVFDAMTVASNNVSCSAGPGDLASEAYGSGTGTADPVYSAQANLELRAKFGRTSVTSTFDGVKDQSTIDDHTLGLLNARGDALLIPAPKARMSPDLDVAGYSVGDTVAYQLHERLGINGAYRLRKRTVSVSDTGVETVTVEFV